MRGDAYARGGVDTPGMDPEWTEQARAALLAGDGAQLVALFERALAAEGRDGATRAWLEALSGFDADAVTG
jgi:hypothetical protein